MSTVAGNVGRVGQSFAIRATVVAVFNGGTITTRVGALLRFLCHETPPVVGLRAAGTVSSADSARRPSTMRDGAGIRMGPTKGCRKSSHTQCFVRRGSDGVRRHA